MADFAGILVPVSDLVLVGTGNELDVPGVVVPTPVLVGEGGLDVPGIVVPVSDIVVTELSGDFGGGGPPAPTVLYPQRIYDTVLADWVYYTKTAIDPAPLSGETIPNHTGNLDVAKHELL